MESIAYFDNAATTFPKPEEVYQFTDSFYRECGVNVGRGQHKLSSKATMMVSETRNLMLSLNNCLNRNVVFTASATEALNVILNSIIDRDEITVYLSPFEHNAVVRVIYHLQNKYKINLLTLAFDKDSLTYDLEQIPNQFSANSPDVVIISHASNVNGILAPISDIFKLSKKYSATNLVDMCQTMGLINTNLNNEDIDFAIFAVHKTLYGMMGLGGFICKPNARLKPLLYGGTGIDSASLDLPETIPERYEVGTPNLPAIASLNASLKWINTIGIANIYAKEQENRKRLIELLANYDNIKTVFCTSDEQQAIGVVSCVFDGYSSDNIGQVLSENNIAVRTGLHCAPSAHRFMNTFPGGTVRFSVGYFNTIIDYHRLDDALSYIQRNS